MAILDPGALARLQINAALSATDDQQPLVAALGNFLSLVAPYVRAGVSAPPMVAAFADGVDALRAIAADVPTAASGDGR